jgi:probable HAF family extracellular repeat protein
MKTRLACSVLSAAILLAGTAHAGDAAARKGTKPRYHLELLASIGGTSVGNSINDRGWIAGTSNLAGDTGVEATLWRGQRMTRLGTLGGANSAVLWPVKNQRGIVAGIAQTAQPDPYNERWSCYYFFPGSQRSGTRCLGFRWERGVMTPLPTLGGTHGFATGANNRGQIVGWAENTVHDAGCVAPQVLQFRAVVWGPGHGQVRELPPLPGDSVSSATAINDRGQVVGISGECGNAVGGVSAKHNVLWENGRPSNIGDFGGQAWNTPMSINQRGDIVGFANDSAADGTGFNPRAFVKLRGQPIRRLEMLPGDVTSQALGINERRQVVGQSCDAAGQCRAFLWHEGEVVDLAAIDDADSVLYTANDIDDSGTITGQAIDEASGAGVAFRATPRLSR